ncbi:glutaminyl-tRNA synthetase [Candidatus Tremblaya phenacola PAVE]|nr:glutaminyl-tRNA synthetase [Candidatus Tremblaya phenacola PAVE]
MGGVRSYSQSCRLVTRFPPEPNGPLHVGHLKSLSLNISLAKKTGGCCLLRFDDTNPKTERRRHVSSIIKILCWLGLQTVLPCFASDNYALFFSCALVLIKNQLLYIDHQDPEHHRTNRGTFSSFGSDSHARAQPLTDNIRQLKQMGFGRFRSQTKTLKAKLNMMDPNPILRDPILCRISFSSHHKTKHFWSLYPTYDYAQCISDCGEGITHSFCTLEFESNRPLYNQILTLLTKAHILAAITELPKQIEFSRLSVNKLLTSKRQVRRLVLIRAVNCCDDLRLGTIVSMRRAGFTKSSLWAFAGNQGMSRSPSQFSLAGIHTSIKKELGRCAPQKMAIIRSSEFVIENFGSKTQLLISIPNSSEVPSFSGKSRLVCCERILIETANVIKFLQPQSDLVLQLEFSLKIRLAGIVRTPDGGLIGRGRLVWDDLIGASFVEKAMRLCWTCANYNRRISTGLLQIERCGLLPNQPSNVSLLPNEWESKGLRFQAVGRGYFVVDIKTDKAKANRWNFITRM